MGNQTCRYAYLDGLRAILAMLVVNEHLVKAFYPNASIYETAYLDGVAIGSASLLFTPVHLIYNGAAAVSFFFVLSGWLVANSLSRHHNLVTTQSGYFLLKRYLRFAVPVTAMLLIVYVMAKAGAFQFMPFHAQNATNFIPLYVEQAPTLVSVLSLGFIESIFFFEARHNIVLWTISFEVYGSILVLALFLFRQNGLPVTFRTALYSVAFLMVAYALRNNILISFIIGIGIFECQRRISFRWLQHRFTQTLLLTGGFLLVSLGQLGGETNPYNVIEMHFHEGPGFYLYYAWGGGLLLLALLNNKPLQKALSGPGLSTLGQYSFGLYLLHYLVIGSLGMGVYMALGGGEQGFYVAAILVYVTSIAAASVFYRFVENPVLRLIVNLNPGVRLRFVEATDETAGAVITRFR